MTTCEDYSCDCCSNSEEDEVTVVLTVSEGEVTHVVVEKGYYS